MGKTLKLKEVARKIKDGIEETLTYCDFPPEHWTKIRTNNSIERLNREIRRFTPIVDAFPNGNLIRYHSIAGTLGIFVCFWWKL